MTKIKSFICIIVVIFFSTVSKADINGRFTVTNQNSSKLAVLIQINSTTSNEAIGGATIVFGFDTASINISNNLVKNVDYVFHNFSGSKYSSATITKPIKDMIWINIDLPYNQSNQGTVISDETGWTDVVTIYFDITDINGIANFYWRLNSPFWGIYKDDNLTMLESNQFDNIIFNYDITAPQLVGASLVDSNRLELEFSEVLDSTTALNISNYSIDNGISIISAFRSTEQNKIILNTTPHSATTQYTVFVNNVADPSGNTISLDHNSFEYSGHPSSAIEEDIPTGFYLAQNYPNPFNPVTNLSFVIGHSSFVTLKVYDILGNEIVTLVNEEKEPGTYSVQFGMYNLPAGRQDLASGIYFYQLQAGSYSEVKKMILQK